MPHQLFHFAIRMNTVIRVLVFRDLPILFLVNTLFHLRRGSTFLIGDTALASLLGIRIRFR